MSVGEILERDEDRPAYVRFERRAVDDKAATLEAGHYVSRDEDYVLVTPPYSKDVVEKKVDSWFSQTAVNVKTGRVPQRHFDLWKQAYESWKNGQEMPVDGTSVKDWNTLSPAQCKNLISAGCRTIEDLSQANDEALKRIGMGAVDLKRKAKAWLQAAKDHGPLVGQVTSLQRENEQLIGSIDSLQEQITLLSRQLDREDKQAVLPPISPMESIDIGITAADITPEVETTEPETVEKSLAEQYRDKFGTKPHHRMKDSTIVQKLKE